MSCVPLYTFSYASTWMSWKMLHVLTHLSLKTKLLYGRGNSRSSRWPFLFKYYLSQISNLLTFDSINLF